VETILLARDARGTIAVEKERLREAIIEAFRYLALNPSDGSTRTRLARILSVQVSGSLGLALAASSVVDLSRRPVRMRESLAHAKITVKNLKGRESFVEAAFARLAQDSPTVLGRYRLPEEVMTEPADEIIGGIIAWLQYGSTVSDDHPDAIRNFMSLGVAIAPHTSDPDQDIPIVRLVAAKFATLGRGQNARDLVEHLLQLATNPKRSRLAWAAMADVYHRLNNRLEALIALGCALISSEDLELEQAWHETSVLCRLLRDTGLGEMALTVLTTARRRFEQLGVSTANIVRLDTLALQIHQYRLVSNQKCLREEGQEFLGRVLANANEVLKHGDETAPSATMLGQLLLSMSKAGLDVSNEAKEVFGELTKRAGTAVGSLVQTLSAIHPSPSEVLTLLRNTEIARYSEDAGFDAHNVALAAERLLSGREATDDPAVAIFAIELLADRAIAVPGWEVIAAPAPSPQTISAPAATACEVSKLGLSLLIAGFENEGRLVSVFASNGTLSPVMIQDGTGLSLERLTSWGQDLPYRYGVDESNPNLFLMSTEGFEVPELPSGRILLVSDTRLQQFPPNLLRVGGQFAGTTRPMAAAPSLSWLKAARQSQFRPDKRALAWISTAEADGEDRTLPMIADRLSPVLDQHHIHLDTSAALPALFQGAELAIIAAHGSIVPEGQYFQLVADDARLRVSANEFAGALRNVGVVVLFVCSGGRADKHPASNTTVGLSKQLLDYGCSTVIASPWPLDPRVTYHWLPSFLDAWGRGAPVIDANFVGNCDVSKAFPYEPARALAMTVYGDPFVVKDSV
jgi:hypothetical protein